MDVETTRYASWEELREYCRCVAGAVGLAVRRRLRAERPEARPAARRDARARAPADQHHARRRRGLVARPRLPPAGRARALRRHRGRHRGRARHGPAWRRAHGRTRAARAEALLREGLELLPLLDRAQRALRARVRRHLPRPARRRCAAAATTSSRSRPQPLGRRQGCGRSAGRCEGRRRGRRPRRARGRARPRRRRATTVTLLEARPTLGGAVQTLPEREGDPRPAARQRPAHRARLLHRVPRASSSASGRPARSGASALALPVIAEDGSVARIGAGRARAPPLRRTSRCATASAIARVARRLGRLDAGRARRRDVRGRSCGGSGQSQAAIDRFWDVFIRPALNLRGEEVSAALARLHRADGAARRSASASDLVLPVAPLGAMHGDAAGARARASAGAIDPHRTRAPPRSSDGAVVLADGERVEADAIVVALPPAESAALLGEPGSRSSRTRRS